METVVIRTSNRSTAAVDMLIQYLSAGFKIVSAVPIGGGVEYVLCKEAS
jgi:hypothetical protein